MMLIVELVSIAPDPATAATVVSIVSDSVGVGVGVGVDDSVEVEVVVSSSSSNPRIEHEVIRSVTRENLSIVRRAD